ncbi:MAG: PhoH family protein [Ruminococcaceae bacterium]|nr:PhoH family protein [Oscillospiraceae bacterium]
MAEKIFEALTNDIALLISGPFNKNITDLEKAFGVGIVCRGTEFKIIGEDENVRKTLTALNTMTDLYSQGTTLDEQSIHYCINMAQSGDAEKVKNMHSDLVLLTAKGKPIRSKTLGQTEYLKAISKNSITFGIGPAGTGKTYLAVAMAVKAFKSGQVSRIILTRPAVEAGEKLGFLPGDLQNKVDPYLRPLYDGLFDMIGPETFQKLMEKGVIEVAPLAYMRGRTLDDSFIILDEAQNTTKEQMKMFLTRMGNGSKIVVTGDVTQIDLPADKKSGLKDAISILKNIDDIAIIRLSEKDVVRHKLVQDIVKAYEKAATEKPDRPAYNPGAEKRGKYRYVK